MFVQLEGVFNGATVYVLINGSVSSSPVEMFKKENNAILVWASLRANDKVSAVQMLCNRTSTPSETQFTLVTAGTLKISGNSATAVRGTTVAFTISAVDSMSSAPIAAIVSLNGKRMGSTGQVIHYSPALGDPNPTFISNQPAYNDSTFTISLTDPIRNWSLTVRAQPIPAQIPGLGIAVNIDSLTFEIVPT
jgi:hypothetical protein